MGSAASTTGHLVDDLARISPELVLVDPELSRRVRPRLPLLFRRRRPPLAPLRLHSTAQAEPTRRRPAAWSSRPATGSWLAARVNGQGHVASRKARSSRLSRDRLNHPTDGRTWDRTRLQLGTFSVPEDSTGDSTQSHVLLDRVLVR